MGSGDHSGSATYGWLRGASVGMLTVALEGIADAAVQAGLPQAVAGAFIRQTVLTSALLMQEGSLSPADLKDRVTSPAGTTIAGLAVLEDHAVRGAFIRGLEKASAGRGT